jgi:Ca-activated chloride channel family protein
VSRPLARRAGLFGPFGRFGLLFALGLSLTLGLPGCSKRESASSGAVAPAEGVDLHSFKVLASSELKDIEPTLIKAAEQAGVELKLTYAGTLDIVERANAGEPFDAILPASGAYPALALTTKPIAREKLFYSRVALGVKEAKLRALGWDAFAPTWADIAKAAGDGKLRYAMTNPTSSNTGMSALFAVASAVAVKTEDLRAEEINVKVLTSFLSGQKLTAGSSGWLADAFVKDAGGLDAMVNYEAVIVRTNEKLGARDKLVLVYPRDGVISADYPLMLRNANRQDDYNKLVAAFKAEPFQRDVASQAFLRPVLSDVPLAPGLSKAAVAELSFPNRLEVIDAVLGSAQSQWRRPAVSVFVLDVSGSMRGERLDAMKSALKTLAGAEAGTASARYARFQSRERVVLISFSDQVDPGVVVDFDPSGIEAARSQVIRYADDLHVKGGTAIYAALLQAQAILTQELERDSERFASIVLLTDGENNGGPDLNSFMNRNPKSARIFPILFGEASPADMKKLAEFSGGRVFDGRQASLGAVFKEIRGYQ